MKQLAENTLDQNTIPLRQMSDWQMDLDVVLLDRYSADAWYIGGQLSYSVVNDIYEIGNQT